MSHAALILGLGVLGLLICGVATRKGPPVILLRLWAVMGIAGAVLYVWGRVYGGFDGGRAALLLLIFAIPFFIGNVLGWGLAYLRARRDRGPDPMAEGAQQ